MYDLAERDGISIICCDLPENKSVSIPSYIGIDPFSIETTAEERTHLAHELGHCETGSFYSTFSPLDIRAKHEYRANVWAAKQLIPVNEFYRAIDEGLTQAWELAEYFNVTEDLIKFAADYYANNRNII